VIDRRTFIGTLAGGLLASPFPTFAQQPTKLLRIGILGNNSNTPDWEGLRQGLRELGYVDGRNVTMEWRWSEGKTERLPALAIELVELKVDIIVASSTQAIRAAKDATSTIPIVMAVSAYPDKIGLVESLARPGGNVTGLTNVSPDLMGKRFQLLKEIAPKVSRVAVLWNPASPVEPLGFRAVQAAGTAAGVVVQSIEVRTPDDYAAAFANVTASRSDSSLWTLPRRAGSRAFTTRGFSSTRAVCCRMGRVSSTCSDALRPTSTKSSREQSRPTFPSSSRLSSNW
jgi:putative tryptophan/tyrosine transport system substrate-binding protein